MEIRNINALAGDMSQFNNPNYKVLATAQLTITDQTDASNLAGNMVVVTGGKNQIFLTGAGAPYTPDWSRAGSNLVIRPYMIASAITRGTTTKYNPDLFDPWEYPTLDATGSNYIRDINWSILDSSGTETKINVATDNRFDHAHTYTTAGKNPQTITDKRQLVVKSNILLKDSTATIMVKFGFYDPYADMTIPMTYTIDIQCVSTGMGTSKAIINPLDGNSFHNSDPEKIRFHAEYYKDGEAVDLEASLSNAGRNLTCHWYIRAAVQGGWKLLRTDNQDDNELNKPGETPAYEIHRVVNNDIDNTVKTYATKGGTMLIVHPDLIAGSDVVKLVITDDTQNNQSFNALEVLYDYTDPTRAYIYSSNGDKLFKGQAAPGTIIKPVVTYQGELLEDDDPKYGEGVNAADGIFLYYWYRIAADGNTVHNAYMNGQTLSFKNTNDADYVGPNWPKSSDRKLSVKPSDIENKGTFIIDLVDKLQIIKMSRLKDFYDNAISQEDLLYASKVLEQNGSDPYDVDAMLYLAVEMQAFINAQIEDIANQYKE